MVMSQEPVQVQEAAQACLEEVAIPRLEATEAALVDQQEGANQALARALPCSWIFSLCADPTDSPRPKGWETTLEPYRMLNHVIGGSQRHLNRLKQVSPNP